MSPTLTCHSTAYLLMRARMANVCGNPQLKNFALQYYSAHLPTYPIAFS